MSNHEESDLKAEAPEAPSTPADSKADMTQELEEARRKAAENWDLFLRTRADAENGRRRAVIDIENAHKYGIEKFARELLGVVDSLDHGLASHPEEEKGLREGMELTYKLLINTLEKFGIHLLNPLGESFDPMRHEALSTQVNNDVEPNKILIVVQKGFTLHDRLLRPARVIVSKAEAE